MVYCNLSHHQDTPKIVVFELTSVAIYSKPEAIPGLLQLRLRKDVVITLRFISKNLQVLRLQRDLVRRYRDCGQ